MTSPTGGEPLIGSRPCPVCDQPLHAVRRRKATPDPGSILRAGGLGSVLRRRRESATVGLIWVHASGAAACDPTRRASSIEPNYPRDPSPETRAIRDLDESGDL